jgi:hypothetical protein
MKMERVKCSLYCWVEREGRGGEEKVNEGSTIFYIL